MSREYDPQSLNAVLSRIEANQENKAIVDAERWQKMEQWMELHQLQCDDRGRRIEKLENWRFYIIGIATGAGFILVKLWDWLSGPHTPK